VEIPHDFLLTGAVPLCISVDICVQWKAKQIRFEREVTSRWIDALDFMTCARHLEGLKVRRAICQWTQTQNACEVSGERVETLLHLRPHQTVESPISFWYELLGVSMEYDDLQEAIMDEGRSIQMHIPLCDETVKLTLTEDSAIIITGPDLSIARAIRLTLFQRCIFLACRKGISPLVKTNWEVTRATASAAGFVSAKSQFDR
jgi:hypothetical protein